MEKDFIIHNGKKYEYCIIRKKIRNINMRVKPDKSIVISIPKKISNKYIKEFVESKISWIDKQLKYYDEQPIKKEKLDFENDETTYFLGKEYKLKILEGNENRVILESPYLYLIIKKKYIANKNYIEKVYEAYLKQCATQVLTDLVRRYQEEMKKYNIPIPTIQIKKMKTKWGSCMPYKNKVTFNLKLMNTPIECIEYVVVHELSHFKHPNHRKSFYNFVEKFMPDWKDKRKLLNKKYNNVI